MNLEKWAPAAQPRLSFVGDERGQVATDLFQLVGCRPELWSSEGTGNFLGDSYLIVMDVYIYIYIHIYILLYIYYYIYMYIYVLSSRYGWINIEIDIGCKCRSKSR